MPHIRVSPLMGLSVESYQTPLPPIPKFLSLVIEPKIPAPCVVRFPLLFHWSICACFEIYPGFQYKFCQSNYGSHEGLTARIIHDETNQKEEENIF